MTWFRWKNLNVETQEIWRNTTTSHYKGLNDSETNEISNIELKRMIKKINENLKMYKHLKEFKGIQLNS
jgi:predicted nucleotidyltransferase